MHRRIKSLDSPLETSILERKIKGPRKDMKEANLASSESSSQALLPGLVGGLSLFEESLRHLDVLQKTNREEPRVELIAAMMKIEE